MDTSEFLRMVLPSAGWYMSATPNPKGRGYFHTPTQDIDKLATKVAEVSQDQNNAYFALANFERASYTDADGKRHYRTAANAVSARSFWLDIDCGPDKPYATIKDGFAAYKKFRSDYNIPKASFLNVSGNGLHVYWAMDQDIPKAKWQLMAHVLLTLARHAEFKFDAKLTGNIACVLRPPGTKNWKDLDNPKPVFINGGTRQPVAWKAFGSALINEVKARGIVVRPPAAKAHRTANSANSEYGDGMDPFPPSDPDKAADLCAMLGAMRETKGANQEDPEWLAAMTNLRKAEGGVEKCIEWSSGHPKFDRSACEAKIAHAESYNAYTCETIRGISPHCKGCKIDVQSPIRLGEIRPETQVEVVDEATGEVEVLPEFPPSVARHFRWSEEKGLMGTVRDAKTGVETERVVNEFLIVADYMWRDVDNVAMTHIRARIRPHIWVEGDIPTKIINKGGAHLAGEVGETLNIGIKTAANQLLGKLLQTWIQHIRAHTDEHAMRKAMGWQEDGSFLLGNQLYREDGTVTTAMIGKNLAGMVAAHTPVGDIDRYTELVDTLYNRPQREIYQFAYAAGFASILPALFHHQPTGLVLAMSSPETGVGKSTIAKLGIGVWGNPNANGQSMKSQSATELAMYTMAGQRRHLPVLIDETTMWPIEQMRNFLYGYSDGTAKLQAKAEGGLRDNSHLQWNNTLYITTNTNVVELLKTNNGNAAPQIARVFEVVVPSLKGTKHALDVGQQRLVRELTQDHYAIAGDKFLRFVVAHKAIVVDLVQKRMEKLGKDFNLGTEARYWKMLVACSLVAFTITRKLGLHKFDPKAFYTWVTNQLRHMASLDTSARSDSEDILANMLLELNPGLIITSTEGGGSGREPAKGFGNNPTPRLPNGTITGRVISNDKTMQCYIPITVVKRFCSKYLIDYSSLRRDLEDQKLLFRGVARYQLTRGLPLVTGRTACWSLNVTTLRKTLLLPGEQSQPPEDESDGEVSCTTTGASV